MKMLGKCFYAFPLGVRHVVMAKKFAVNVRAFPMAGESSGNFG